MIAKVVPEETLPELCYLIHHQGSGGIQGIITDFQRLHPQISKRQIEKQIREMAIKTKKEEESDDPKSRAPVWTIKPEFDHLLMDYKGGQAAHIVQARASGTGGGESGSGGGKGASAEMKRKREESGDGSSVPEKVKKSKNAITLFMQENRKRAKDATPNGDQEEIKAKIRQ